MTLFLCVFVCVYISASQPSYITVIDKLTYAAFYSVHKGAGLPVPGLEDPRIGMNLPACCKGVENSRKLWPYIMESMHLP